MNVTSELWLAPLRGVTIRAFRETFAAAIREAGFAGAFAPFIPANPGLRVGDRLLDDLRPFPSEAPLALPLVPQVITKHPDAMRTLLRAFREHGFDRADLNAGCPFPMIVRRGRGSGLLRTPDVLESLLAAGCEEMGAGKFSLKVRLGVESPDDLRALLPRINRYPLAALTVHARTAKQMYAGEVDRARFAEILAESTNPVIYNGDAELDHLDDLPDGVAGVMVGRAFIRALGARADAGDLLRAYIKRSREELCGDVPVLGRMKELLTYWCSAREDARPPVMSRWRRIWPVVKLCRTVDELLSLV
jgi:tRNA-dihydrouridine synthase